MKNIIFICQTVDNNDPLLAVSVDWIREFSYRPEIENVMVIALRAGEFSLPDNVTVKTIKGSNSLITAINFYKEILKNLKKSDSYFIHMGGPYPALLLPFRLFFGKKVYQWNTHSYIRPLMKFQAWFCLDKIFTATSKSFAMSLKKVKVIGHGIDIDLFRPHQLSKQFDIITTGRFSPIKKLDKILRLIYLYKKTFNKDLTANFYGPLEGSQKFKNNLDNYRDKLGLNDNVLFKGSVNRDKIPELLNQHKIFISFSDTGLDKASLEAMACGIPVLTSNKRLEEILPNHLKEILFVKEDDIEDQLKKVNKIINFTNEEYATLGSELRVIVKHNHATPMLVDKIFTEINNYEK